MLVIIKKIKMQKNHLFIVLACLNCVHTTHAVENAPVATKIKGAIPEDFYKEKTVHYSFQGKCFNAGRKINDPDMMQDASVQAAQILLDLSTKLKDNMPHTNPHWPVIKAVKNIRRDIVNDLTNLKKADIEKLMQHQPVNNNNDHVHNVYDYMSELFNTKLEEQVKAGKFPGLTVDMVNMALDRPYESALYSEIPRLDLYMTDLNEDFLPTGFPFDHSLNLLLTNMFGAYGFEIQMTKLQTYLKNNYPDMVQPVWDMYKKVFRHQLNDYIRGNGDRFDIGKAIEEKLLNKPGIKQVTETILDTIRQNQNLDKDTYLHKRTVTVLDRSETLRRLVSNYIEQKNMPLMSLVNTMKHKQKISGSLKKLPDPMFREVGKYLGTQDRSNKTNLGKRVRSDREIDPGPAKRQRTD